MHNDNKQEAETRTRAGQNKDESTCLSKKKDNRKEKRQKIKTEQRTVLNHDENKLGNVEIFSYICIRIDNRKGWK